MAVFHPSHTSGIILSDAAGAPGRRHRALPGVIIQVALDRQNGKLPPVMPAAV